MYCTRCGNELIEGNKYCTRCGQEIKWKVNPVKEDAKAFSPEESKEDVTVIPSNETEEDATVILTDETEEDATVILTNETEEDATVILAGESKEDATEVVNGVENRPFYFQMPQAEPARGGLNNPVFADEYIVNKPSDKGKNVIIALMIGCIVALTILLGVLLFFINSGKSSGEEGESGGGIHLGGSVYGVHLYAADDDSNICLEGAEIDIYEGEDFQKQSKAKVTYDEEAKTYAIKKIKDGTYRFDIKVDGFCEYIDDIEVSDEGSVDIFVTPKPVDGMNVFRVDWNGEHDIDLCMYNQSGDEYVSVGNAVDAYAGCIKKDNGSNSRYELFYLSKELLATGNWTLYAVDSAAVVSDAVSTMEADGITITHYDSTGVKGEYVADAGNDSPIWCVGELTQDGSFNLVNEYLGDCGGTNKWTQLIKLDFTGRFKVQIEELNRYSETLKYFDPSADNYQTGIRNEEQAWDKTVFYALEEHHQSAGYYDKNYCLLKKLQVRNQLTGNLVDYDAYMNPDTGLPNKIVSIEYKDGGIEVMEYYYDNAGKINFIFYYLTDNYVSTYATVNKPGNRFLFDGDCMTTWRIIEGGNKVTNLCSNKTEEARLKEGSWNKRSIFRYDKLGTDERQLYDDMEKRMINFAYNTYDLVCNNEGVGQIIGVAYRDEYSPMAGAVVELYDESFENVLYSTTTDSNGEYVILIPYMEYTYNVRVYSLNGDSSCDIYKIGMDENSFIIYVDSVLFFSDNTSKQEVQLYIGNAFYGYGTSVGDADVYVRSGINNRDGSVLESLKTNAEGYVQIFLLPGMYTVEASKSGFESIYYTIISNPYENNWYEYYTPPTLSEGEYAIVLSWGETPSDLDSHLFTSGGTDSQHVWYRNKNDNYNSFLDVDDTSSYGPETVTIRTFDPNKYYKYCIVDYTNSSMGNYISTDMSYSNATVNVYSSGGHVATYHVPVNKEGVVWEVFEIRNGKLTPIQRYYTGMEDYSWWNH
ncbi:MAG: zinc-ribbon domain-containing protein [Lachnospiraceae bacterium]|nr:zinc-ribbon domain-containing protein [Candidatus Colinaster scatohippi]